MKADLLKAAKSLFDLLKVIITNKPFLMLLFGSAVLGGGYLISEPVKTPLEAISPPVEKPPVIIRETIVRPEKTVIRADNAFCKGLMVDHERKYHGVR